MKSFSLVTESIKSGFVLYKENFIKLTTYSVVLTFVGKLSGLASLEGYKLSQLLLQLLTLAIDIVFIYNISLLINNKHRYKSEDSLTLVKQKFFHMLGINLIIGLMIIITSIPSYICLTNGTILSRKILFALLWGILPFILYTFAFFSEFICVLRDIDDNHRFINGSITESFILVKKNFIPVLFTQILFVIPSIPFVIQFILSIHHLDLSFLASTKLLIINSIISIIIIPLSYVTEIIMLYRILGIKYDKVDIDRVDS